MKRWLRRIVIAAALIAVASGLFFESVTRVGRGWLNGEPFYYGRPASYWANEIERWETQNPNGNVKTYVRRPTRPRWLERRLPPSGWPRLLDGDPDGLAVLQALRKHPSSEVQDWARIGIERIDNGERGPYKFKHPSVIMTAQLYEVDEAFYKEVAKARRLSKADLEELERQALNPPKEKQPEAESLFALLEKQKLLLAGKEINIDHGQEGVLLALSKANNCLPSLDQLRQGQKGPQTIHEGVSLRAQVHVSADRRFVRAKFVEKSVELEGTDKVNVVLDETGKEVVGEIAFLKEGGFSQMRDIPDGGSFLLPLQYRPGATRDNDRWLVVQIVPRIYIEEEERLRRGQVPK